MSLERKDRSSTLIRMTDWRDELIPPDDPRFEGVQFLSEDARLKHVVENSPHLRGTKWHWAVWKEREAVEYDPRTEGRGTDCLGSRQCHFCYARLLSPNATTMTFAKAGQRRDLPEHQPKSNSRNITGSVPTASSSTEIHSPGRWTRPSSCASNIACVSVQQCPPSEATTFAGVPPISPRPERRRKIGVPR
jgi:hypothetical protein